MSSGVKIWGNMPLIAGRGNVMSWATTVLLDRIFREYEGWKTYLFLIQKVRMNISKVGIQNYLISLVILFICMHFSLIDSVPVEFKSLFPPL